jgi:hypothetical protein
MQNTLTSRRVYMNYSIRVEAIADRSITQAGISFEQFDLCLEEFHSVLTLLADRSNEQGSQVLILPLLSHHGGQRFFLRATLVGHLLSIQECIFAFSQPSQSGNGKLAA